MHLHVALVASPQSSGVSSESMVWTTAQITSYLARMPKPCKGKGQTSDQKKREIDYNALQFVVKFLMEEPSRILTTLGSLQCPEASSERSAAQDTTRFEEVPSLKRIPQEWMIGFLLEQSELVLNFSV